jgi:hypothetical protein
MGMGPPRALTGARPLPRGGSSTGPCETGARLGAPRNADWRHSGLVERPKAGTVFFVSRANSRLTLGSRGVFAGSESSALGLPRAELDSF